ncbi:MAG: hypothetical protein ABMA64_31280 [Myxococcota bacterium]
MTVPAEHEWIDPQVLRVDWLEHAMLVHAITLSGDRPSPWVHPLFAGAVGTGIGGAVALSTGWLVAAGALGLAWVGFAAGLSVEAWRVARAAPPVRRRLLIELRPDQLAWTVLDGDRWSMQHQHELPFPTVSRAAPVDAEHGAEVDLTLLDGSHRRIPLHGLPAADAQWLAARIGEGIEAAADAAID